MSQIDEAFIQAYATSSRPGTVPVAHQPPLAGLHTGHHLPPAPQPSAETQSTAWAPEPVPAPHFQIPGARNPSTPSSGTQAPSPQPEVARPTVRPPAPVSAPVATAASPAAISSGVQHIARPPSPPAVARRPLSSYASPSPPTTTAFHPVFEVDGFRWPAITTQLLDAHHELLLPVVDQLLDVSEQGRSLIGISGTRPNVGCSTMLLCLSRLLASAGKSLALVDANFSKASLARDLGLAFDVGWENVLTGELPLAECVVKSLEDRMSLLPLTRPTPLAGQLLESIHTSVTAGVLRYNYDLVLFNLGTAAQSPQDVASYSIMQHCRLDANIIIADTDRTGIEPIDTLMSLFGSTCLGVIGNTAA